MTAAELVLVEDDPADVKLALHALGRAGFSDRTRVLRDGAEALALLADPQVVLPRVLLMDVKMPKVDGLEVLERLRALPRTRTLPVVLLSSSQQPRDLARAHAAGCNAYVVKPVDFDAYARALRVIGEFWLDINAPVGAM